MSVKNKWILLFILTLIISVGLVSFQNGDVWFLFDDFESLDGLFTQSLDTSEHGSARIANGKLESMIWAAKEYNYFPVAVDVPEAVWIDVDVNLVSDELAVGAGVACNFDSLTYNGVFFEIIFDQDIDIFAVYNGTYYFLKEFGTDNAYWVDDSEDVDFYHSNAIDSYGTNTIHMICDHGLYTVGVNGQTLGSFPAPPFELDNNKISLYSYAYFDEGGTVQFDNFSVEERFDQISNSSGKPTAQNQPSASKWSYFENFDDGASDFFVSSSNAEGISVNHINGGLEIENPSTIEKKLLTNTVRGYAENVLIEVNAALVQGNPSNGVRLVCNANDNGDGLVFEVDFDQEYKMFAYHNGEHYQFTDFGSTNQSWSQTEDTIDFLYSSAISSTTNYISVECNNGSFSFSVNGQLLQKGSYPFNFEGKDIDLISVKHMGDDYTVRFDNFYVEEIGYESVPMNAPTPSSSPLNNNNSNWSVYTEFATNDGYFTEAETDIYKIQYINSGFEMSEFLKGKMLFTKLQSDVPKNSSVEIDLSFINGESSTRAGLSCDFYQSNGNSYGTFFFIGFDGNYYILRSHPSGTFALVNKQWVDTSQSKTTNNPIGLIYPTGTNTIRMDCNHSIRTFYINGEMVVEYEDFEPDYDTDLALLISTGKNSNDGVATVRFTRLFAQEIK